uniref:Uncharacterized protein n=1 Tax=Arundo donax TaxID=35708 RepID=A0A0A9SKF6_ARUDO
MLLVYAWLVYSTTVAPCGRSSCDARSTARCSSASSVLSDSMDSSTFLRRTNRNSGAALWNPVTRRTSPTRYRLSPA